LSHIINLYKYLILNKKSRKSGFMFLILMDFIFPLLLWSPQNQGLCIPHGADVLMQCAYQAF
tara:strand:+ start:636 stop:821 length:186 start_codon:yes stop_codon:yes gene_type:complete